jgi:hypothetical protein
LCIPCRAERLLHDPATMLCLRARQTARQGSAFVR